MSFVLSFAILFAGTFASVVGSSFLRHAALTGSPNWTAAGITLWVVSALSFVHLAKEQDLGTLALLTNIFSLVLANFIGILWFGEPLTARKVLAAALVILAMAVLTLPTSKA